MEITVHIPSDLDPALVRELDQAAQEAVAVLLYRHGKLSHGQFAKFLGIGRGEADEVLGRHGVVDYTADDAAREDRSIRRRLGKHE